MTYECSKLAPSTAIQGAGLKSGYFENIDAPAVGSCAVCASSDACGRKTIALANTMTPSLSKPAGLKLHKRYTPYVFAFYMAGIMAFLMSCTIVAANSGLGSGFVQRVLSAYALAMPVAFCCVVLVRPLVLKLVAITVHNH